MVKAHLCARVRHERGFALRDEAYVMATQTDQQELIRAAHALETHAAFRTWRDVCAVRVRGEDRVSWLNGQLTNDVRQIPAGGSVHALAVNIRGKIMAEVWVADAAALGTQDTLLLLVLGGEQATTTLLESLEKYIIMEDVTLERAPELVVLGLEGPLSAAEASGVTAPGALKVSAAPLGLGGLIWVADETTLNSVMAQLEARVPRVSEDVYELVRLRHGVPRFGADYDEHQYPQEVGLKALVSFQKGCYLGQEVVCTLESRGKLSRQLWVLQSAEATLPAPNTALNLESTTTADAVGAITTAVWDPERELTHVLGYVRRIHAKPGTSVRAGTQSLTLIKPVGEDQAPPASP
jgi:folate-binding protein YgfZ